MKFLPFKKSSLSSTPHFLLIGNPVAHSLSPLMHNAAAEFYDLSIRYHAIQINKNELPAFASYLKNKQLKGVNVTIPYKQAMMDFVNILDASCRKIGALNTIVKQAGQLKGYNTDVYGFCKPLEGFHDEIKDKRAIVFGTGGAARAVAFGLMDYGVDELLLVSRNPKKYTTEQWPHFTKIISYDDWPKYANKAKLMVNATPLGMEPLQKNSPVKEEEILLLKNKICYDIVYKPVQTTFLQQAEQVQARTIGGLDMLVRQGSRSFELWTGKPFPVNLVWEKLTAHLKNEN